MKEIECKTVYELISKLKERVAQGHKTKSHDDQCRLILGWVDQDEDEFFYVIAGPCAPMRMEMSDIDKMDISPRDDGWFIWNSEEGCKIPISDKDYAIMRAAKDADWGRLGLSHSEIREILRYGTSRESFFNTHTQ